MRGTDYRNEAELARGNSPQNSDISKVIQRVIETMNIWGYDYIFLATEDKEYYETFQTNFNGKILSIDQKRINYKENNGKFEFLGNLLMVNGDKEFVNSYISVIYCLSKCQGLIASMPCGAAFAACSWNQGNYEFCEIMKC